MSASHLLVTPTLTDGEYGEYLHITPETAAWDTLHVAARRMAQGERWSHRTGEHEMAIVVLGGVCALHTNRGEEWPHIGRRPDVFSGMPYAVYLPIDTDFHLTAVSDHLDIAYGWCRAAEAEREYPVQLVRPADVTIDIRGGENATRQINNMLGPGFNCHRLVVVEVYTPSGNWSSYPPHKHDQHRLDAEGNLLEAALEEVYFYKLDKPAGYAYQRVYTKDGRLDELMIARHNHAVLVPEGYHPVVSARGYTTYYLNFLAGSAQSLANFDDPDYAWVKETYQAPDPRLPFVSMEMEQR